MKLILFLFLWLICYQNIFCSQYDWNLVFKDNGKSNDFIGIAKADSMNIMSIEESSEDPFPGYN